MKNNEKSHSNLRLSSDIQFSLSNFSKDDLEHISELNDKLLDIHFKSFLNFRKMLDICERAYNHHIVSKF